MPSCDGHQFDPCIAHHPVLENRGGFPFYEKNREFNGLSGLKCGLRSRLCVLHPFCGWKRRPVSTGKIPFPKLTECCRLRAAELVLVIPKSRFGKTRFVNRSTLDSA